MAESFVRLASPLLRFVSMTASLLQRLVAVGAIKGFHIASVGAVACAPLFRARIVGLSLGRCDNRRRRGSCRDGRSAPYAADEIAAVDSAGAVFVSSHFSSSEPPNSVGRSSKLLIPGPGSGKHCETFRLDLQQKPSEAADVPVKARRSRCFQI